MGKIDWKTELTHHFDSLRVIERCQAETIGYFNQFCEFIAESAFESLADELALFRIKSRQKKNKDRDIRFSICFPGTKDDQFHYRISLPKNAVEIRLKLQVKARRTTTADYQTTDEDFMPGLFPLEVLKMDKDDVIHDIIEHYRRFCYAALTSPD
jgi:hypothetical protein